MRLATASSRPTDCPHEFARALAAILVAFMGFAATAWAEPAADDQPASDEKPTATAAPVEEGASPVSPARFLFALDLDGQPHNIGDGDGYKAVAIVFLATDCPVSREYVPTLNRLAAAQGDQPVKFYGVISDESITRAQAVKFQKDFDIKFPVMFDASGEIADVLGPTHVPEAFVLDAGANVVYRGRIDDQYPEPGKKRPQATTHELADALTAVVAGKPVEVARTTPVGCPVEKVAADDAISPTFNRDIAPLLFAKCAECHRPGEVAPFSLLSHADAAKRAGFLATVSRSRKMPPWTAEIGHGDFLAARQLTEQQIAILEAWAKAGAPRELPKICRRNRNSPRAGGWASRTSSLLPRPSRLPCRPMVLTSFNISSSR